jgi:hypothetical protein
MPIILSSFLRMSHFCFGKKQFFERIFVQKGLIDFLTSSHEVAESLRTHIIFKILPVMNPDGVFMGNTRCNLVTKLHKVNNYLKPFFNPFLDTE